MKIELLCGNGIHKAFKEIGIDAKRIYKRTDEPHYEVWEIEKKDLEKLEETVEWDENWGFWRFCKGSNMGSAYEVFTVNGHELIAWSGRRRDNLIDEWNDEPSSEKEAYHYSYKEYEKAIMPHEYDSLLDYFGKELEISTEKNICALSVDLARYNGMSMAQLFKTYEG